jgi:hypothetical protein
VDVMPGGRLDRHGGGGSSDEHGRFPELWDDGGMHHAQNFPPDPAHQRAINLLPMHGDGGEQSGAAGCSLHKKRRVAAGKRPYDDNMEAPDSAQSIRAQMPAAAQHEGGREPGGQKKLRKKSKRVVQNKDDITIFPRRKAGQDKLGSNRPPIVISRSVLESYFNMPQQKVCEKLVSFPGRARVMFVRGLVFVCAITRHHRRPDPPSMCLQGICATVIKKVCRQLGIDKWPFKGNKITLRKQGLCPSRKKGGRAQSPETEAPRPSSVSGEGMRTGMQHAPRAFQSLQQESAMGRAFMDQVQAQARGQQAQAQAQALMRQQQVPAATYRQTEKKAPAVDFEEQLQREIQMRRGGSGLDLCLPGGRAGGMGGAGGGLTHPGLLQRAAMQHGAGDWRMGSMPAAPVSVFSWESRAVMPGAAQIRGLLAGVPPQRDHQFAHHAPAGRSLPVGSATGSSGRCLSPAGGDGPRLFSSDAAGGGLRQFCASKLSPPADESLDIKRESTSSDKDTSDKDNSIGLEDDAEGFDLSWLVPSDNLRGMPDIDGDMLERLRTPFHFAEN